jgi:hypothetical protein
MPVDRNATLPKEVYETITKWIDKLTEELKSKFDVGFRPGVYILHTADGDGLPDGIWVLFPPKTLPELADGLLEAGHASLQNFMKAGLREKLDGLRKTRQDNSQPPDGNLY